MRKPSPVSYNRGVRRILLDLRPLQNGYAAHGIGRYTRELTLALLDALRQSGEGESWRLETLTLGGRPWPEELASNLATAPAPHAASHPATHLDDRPPHPPRLYRGLTCPPWRRIWLWDQCVLGPQIALGRWDLYHSFAALGPLAETSLPWLGAPRSLATVHDLHLFKPDAEPVLQAYRRTWRIRLQSLALPRAHRIVVDAPPIDSEVRHRFKLAPHARIACVSPGIDHRAFTSVPARESALSSTGGLDRRPANAEPQALAAQRPPYLLAVGDSPDKAVSFAAQCVLALHRAGTVLPLIVVGEPSLIRARIRAEAPDAAAWLDTPNLQLPGHLSDAALMRLYAGATALVYPSRREGFGFPILEAQAQACPVLTVDRDPMRSLNAEPSHRLPEGDTTAWCQALLRLANDPAWRLETGQSGQAWARTFTWRRAAEAVLSLWREALQP